MLYCVFGPLLVHLCALCVQYSCTKIMMMKRAIASCEMGVNVLMGGLTDGRKDGRSEYVMPLTTYCMLQTVL